MPSIMATIGANATTFFSTMRGVEGHVKRFGAGIKQHMGGKLAGFFSMANLEQSAGAMLELGGRVQDISNRLGISTDAVQQWDYALKQNGSSIEAALPFFQKLSQAREKALSGDQGAVDDFKQLGVSMDQLKTGRVEDIAETIAKTFQTGDPQKLFASLVSVGGKAAGSMAAAFRDGLPDALKEASVVPPEDIAALDEASDKVGELKNVAVSMFAPLISDLASFILGTVDIAERSLGAIVGAMMGVVDAVSKTGLSFESILSLPERLAKGFADGASEGADAVLATHEERDKKAKEKKERLKKGNKGDFDPEAAEAKAAEKEQKEQDKLGKKAAADKARAEKKAKKDEADLARDVENEIAKEEANNVGLTKREGSAGFGYGGVHAGMSAGPELSAMNAQLRTEEHLREIKEMIKKNKGKVTEDSGDVEYE
jgi:hypothetical protein